MSVEYKYRLYYNGTTPFDEYIDSPKGWNEFGIELTRSKFYHSIRNNTIFSLQFDRKTDGGGELLKAAYDESGLYGEVFFEISKRNPQTDDYDFFNLSVADYKTYQVDRDYVNIGFISSSKEELFYTRDDIDYNLLNRP